MKHDIIRKLYEMDTDIFEPKPFIKYNDNFDNIKKNRIFC